MQSRSPGRVVPAVLASRSTNTCYNTAYTNTNTQRQKYKYKGQGQVCRTVFKQHQSTLQYFVTISHFTSISKFSAIASSVHTTTIRCPPSSFKTIQLKTIPYKTIALENSIAQLLSMLITSHQLTAAHRRQCIMIA